MGALAMAEDEYWANSQKFFDQIRVKITSAESLNQALHDFEDKLSKDLNELGRLLFQEYIDAHGNGDVGASIIREDGKVLNHKREGSCQIISQFGKVKATPQGYGQRGEDRIFPLKEELLLPARSFTYSLQRKVCFEAIKGPYSRVTETLDEYTSAHVSKQQIDHIVNDAAVDFDAFYRTANQKSKIASQDIIVATADGKGIIMRKEDLREATKKRAISQKLEKRKSKGEKSNRKRMSTVASVYNIGANVRTVDDIIDEFDRKQNQSQRPRPENKRVWASVEKSQAEVFQEISREVKSRLSEGKIVAFLSDGEKQLKNLAKNILKPVLSKSNQFYMVLDIVHAIEYLWKAAHVFHKEGSKEAEAFVSKYLRWLLEGNAGQVAAAIGRLATKLRIEDDKRTTVDKVVTYIKNNKPYMQYDRYLELGLPIATGVIEGACKSLVKDRFEVTGARWTLRGAESLLKLRAIYQSDDWKAYWNFHIEQECSRLYPKGHWRVEEKNAPPKLTVLAGGKSS